MVQQFAHSVYDALRSFGGFLLTIAPLLAMPWAALAGSGIAALLGLWSFQARHALLILLPAASPLAFLVTDHSGLLLALATLLVLVSLWFTARTTAS